MPEEEGEDKPDADAHDPGHQHEHQQAHVGKGLTNICIFFLLKFKQTN